MRSSRRSRRAGWLLAFTAALAGVAEVSAHRRDEYLQAARIAIDPARVEIELDLTPGIALADAILGDIDRNRDGSVSAAEQQAYASLVLSALEIEVDTMRLAPQPGVFNFPELDAVRRGEGTIRLHFTAPLPRLSAGVHQFFFRNKHERNRSVYLANALVPQNPLVAVTAQRRDTAQTELTIDYVLRGAPAGSTAAWLLGSLAAATALFGLLLRPLRSLR